MNYQLTSLPSGLRVASETLPSVESVTLVISFNAGARNESAAQHGLAHLLEHMAFKGTAKRNARQIAEAFDDIGGAVNAYTSMEKTVYYARVLHQHLPVAIDILADILQNSSFDAQELEREQQVIVQEIGMHQDSPEDLIFDYLHEVAYGAHPLGRTILGTNESVCSFTADDLQKFIDSHYHASSMVITAAGKVNHDRLVALIGEAFSESKQGEKALSEPAKMQSGARHVVRDDLEQTQVMMAYEGVTSQDINYYPTQLLSTIFGGGMSSRLFQEVREKRGLAYSVSSFLTSYHECGFFGIYAATGADKVEKLTALLQEEAFKLTHDINDQEIERAKNQQRAGLLMKRESVTGVAEWIARHLQDHNEYRNAYDLTKRIDEISKTDLQKAATEIFENKPHALTTLGPSE